jgi:hypothetical protein
MRVQRDWSRMSQDQKIEALRTDINAALDQLEAIENRDEELKNLRATIEKLARSVFEIREKLGMP